MAGRGCTVKIQILRQDGNEVFTDEIALPVALHSPVSVLKDLLQDISHIAVPNQVLILCDLTDPDRNNDVHLNSSLDGQTLFQCGVQHGSVLSLHALGVSPSAVNCFSDLYVKQKLAASKGDPRPVLSLTTAITPAQANHSFNGVIFDMISKSPFEVDVCSVSIGGMLGRVRVFYKYGTWLDEDINESADPQRWWGISERVCTDGWNVAADSICTPSWDNPHEVVFRKPINLLPGQRIALYLHSGLPDDLGIQYQTYNKDSIVAEDDHIVLFPGVGHTGAEPFDQIHGWYRAYRGLAGVLSYRCHRKGWTIWSHKKFPKQFRQSVLTILLCREHSLNLLYSKRRFLLNATNQVSSPVTSCLNTPIDTVDVDRKRQIGLLHTHVVYYIMEFMHWDWFPATEAAAPEDSRESLHHRRTAAASIRQLLMRAAASGLDISSESAQEGIAQLYSSIMMNLAEGMGTYAGDEAEDDMEEIGDETGSDVYETDDSELNAGTYESESSEEDDVEESSEMETDSEGNVELMSEGSDEEVHSLL